MASIDACCVNLSGSNCPVYNSANIKIGDIEPRAFSTCVGNEGGLYAVYFFAPSGTMARGYLSSPSMAVLTQIHTQPYGFVDTGMRSGTPAGSIALYRTW